MKPLARAEARIPRSLGAANSSPEEGTRVWRELERRRPDLAWPRVRAHNQESENYGNFMTRRDDIVEKFIACCVVS